MKKIVYCLAVVLLAGCQTTGDPKSGGLFGWSEEKAVQRQGELNQALAAEQQRGESEKIRTQELETEKRSKEAELDAQKRELAEIESELDSITKKISKVKATTGAKVKEKQKVEKDLKRLKDEVKKLKADQSADIQKKKQRIDELNKEIEKLMKTAEAM